MTRAGDRGQAASPTCRACSGSWPTWRCSWRGPACCWPGPSGLAGPGGTPPPLETALAKTAANLAAKFVCDEAMQIHGGYGYSREYPLERAYRDIRGLCIGAGHGGGPAQLHRLEHRGRPDHFLAGMDRAGRVTGRHRAPAARPLDRTDPG